MSIQVTTLKGTNSIAADRITINDNFSITKDAINELLGIIDTTTGEFDNTGVGANSTVTTEGITVTINGIEVQAGDITINNGNIILAPNSKYIQFGADSAKLKQLPYGAGATANLHVLDTSEGFSGVSVPSLTVTDLNTLGTNLGATGPNVITFDSTNSKFKGWNGSSWVDLS